MIWESGRSGLAVSSIPLMNMSQLEPKQKLKISNTKSHPCSLLLTAWSAVVYLATIPSNKPVKKTTAPAYQHQRRGFKLLAAQEFTAKSREPKHLQNQEWCGMLVSASGGWLV